MVLDKKRSGVPNALAVAAHMHDGQASAGVQPGSYEAQIYQDDWGQGEVDGDSGEDDSLSKVDRALPIEVNIPLDHKGELVSFREVHLWKVPTQADLAKLKNRINEEWIKPLNLKQQDIVKASGLGAPYVCYLLKDPNCPNMNRRRKIEAFSVLTELFRKYDAKIVTKEDFVNLRNRRVANRFQGPRQDRSGRGGSAAGRTQQRRRRRKNDPYDEDLEDDEVSADEDMNDPSGRMKRRRHKNYGGHMYYPDQMYVAAGSRMPMYPPPMGMGMAPGAYPAVSMHPPHGYPPMPNYVNIGHNSWAPNPTAKGRMQYSPDAAYQMPVADGQPFQAPYPEGFPPVMRSVTQMAAPALDGGTSSGVVDGPPSSVIVADKAALKSEENSLNDISSPRTASKHDAWVREKVSQLSKQVIMPKTQGKTAIFREPAVHSFVFLIDRSSCLLPIGVKITSSPAIASVENMWDIMELRRAAEEAEWLDENRDWDDCLWVLWDIKETGSAVQALFDKWRQDHNLRDDDIKKVATCFLSQYTYLRDVELSFRALLEYSVNEEDFYKNVEINCDLLEERIRVKDAFVWDIRASDWDLTALLSNFVADFQLETPAISSLFIDLKTTILRYRKEWVSQMLERLTAERKIDPAKILPGTLGFEESNSIS